MRARGIRAPTPSAMTYLTREQIQNEGKGERVWPVAPQILSGDALRLLQSSLPALQGSSPFSSNRSAILHLLPLLQQIRAGSLPAAPRSFWFSSDVPSSASLAALLPGAACLHHRDTATLVPPLLFLCSVSFCLGLCKADWQPMHVHLLMLVAGALLCCRSVFFLAFVVCPFVPDACACGRVLLLLPSCLLLGFCACLCCLYSR